MHDASRTKELMDLAKLIAEGDGHFSPLECREAVKYLLSLVEWRPIETAPKDGSNILVCKIGHKYAYLARWEVDPGWAWKGAPQCWAVYMADDDHYSMYLEPDWPTHWLPPTTPPTSKEQA